MTNPKPTATRQHPPIDLQPPAADFIESSKALGSELRLSNYLGGSASAKRTDIDMDTSEHVEKLWALTGTYSEVEHEDAMVAAFGSALYGGGGAADEIDTALNGLDNAEQGDRFHPDGGKFVDGEVFSATAFGEMAICVPWRHPGFQLGLDITAIAKNHPQAVGTILGKHSITAWGDTSADSGAYSRQSIGTATRYRADHDAAVSHGAQRPECKILLEHNQKPLAARVTVVTDAAVDKAIAACRVTEGACVIIANPDPAEAARVATALGTSETATSESADVSDEAGKQAALKEAALAYGGIDLIVNYAGPSLSKPPFETAEKDWDIHHDVMATGSFLVSKTVARVLVAQNIRANMIVISSNNSVFAGPNIIGYSAAKADQTHEVRPLAAERGRYGIRVDGINPDGAIRGSDTFAGGWSAQCAKTDGVGEENIEMLYAHRTILGHEPLPEHIANAAFALCTSDISHTTDLHVPVAAGVAATPLH